MIIKIIIVALVIIVCAIICVVCKKKGNSQSFIATVSIGVLASTIFMVFVPNISIYDAFDNQDIVNENNQTEENKQQELIASSPSTTELSTNETNISTSNEIETNVSIHTQEQDSEFTNITIPITSPPNEDVTIILNANGGNIYLNEITLKCGDFYNNLSIPKRDFYTFKGWYTEIDGGIPINENSIVTNPNSHTLYAHWEYNEASKWVSSSQVPSNAEIIERKWTYTLTETKESNNPSEFGWKQIGSYWQTVESGTHTYANFPINSNGYEYYNTSDYYYQKYNKAPYYNSEDSNNKREIIGEQIGSYIYYHWVYPLSGYHTEMDRIIGNYNGESIKNKNGNYRGETNIWEAFEGEYSDFNSQANAFEITGHSTYSYWWNGGIPVYTQTYTDYVKVYQYEREISDESDTIVFEGNGISNVQELIRYQLK